MNRPEPEKKPEPKRRGRKPRDWRKFEEEERILELIRNFQNPPPVRYPIFRKGSFVKFD
jgi:hypothetical protein